MIRTQTAIMVAKNQEVEEAVEDLIELIGDCFDDDRLARPTEMADVVESLTKVARKRSCPGLLRPCRMIDALEKAPRIALGHGWCCRITGVLTSVTAVRVAIATAEIQ